MRRKQPIIIIGVIGNDIHVIANRILHICLVEAGMQVINLGVNNMPQDFADAALEVGADAVLIGSLNGEALHWCREIRPLFTVRGIHDTLVYIGGNLVTGSLAEQEVMSMFSGLGIDRVYHGTVDFDSMIATLRKDIDGRPVS